MPKPRILIVDDDPKLSKLVGLFLHGTGLYDVRQENRSANALQSAREYQPSLILLDVDMPGKDGGEVARELQADPSTCDAPVIFFTSLIGQTEAGSGIVMRGGARFLAKPIQSGILQKSVAKVLAECRAA